MRNLFLRSSIIVQLLLCVTCYGMLSVENNKAMLWEIIIANGFLRDDYKAHRNCALVDKRFNKIIEDNYRKDKKRIEKFIRGKSNSVTGYRSWNKGFNKCAWINIIDSSSGEKNLKLTLVGLAHDNSKCVISSSRLWQDFQFPVFEDDVRPFFDKDGRACFYGFGNTTNRYRREISFIECSIDLDGKAECCDCGFIAVTPDKEGYGNMVYYNPIFLNFPLLLKAWLQSKLVTVIELVNGPKMKNYNINAVTLPNNYKTFKKHVVGLEKCFTLNSKKNPCTSYDDVPKELRKAIDKRYQEQQREKKDTAPRMGLNHS